MGDARAGQGPCGRKAAGGCQFPVYRPSPRPCDTWSPDARSTGSLTYRRLKRACDALTGRSESDVQKATVELLRLAGFDVRHTTAYRQRGPSGVSLGVPDLLVGHIGAPGSLLGIEVKKPGGRVRPAQKEWADKGLIVVCDHEDDALEAAVEWLKRSPTLTKGAARRAETVLAGIRRG